MRGTSKVFLSFAFSPKSQAYSKAEIESALEQACETAQTGLRGRGLDWSVMSECYLEEYGQLLPSQLRTKVENADIVVAEVTENNVNVFYELGLAHGQNKNAILLQSKKAPSSLPSDLLGTFLLRYDNVSDIRGRLADAIERLILNDVRKRSEVDQVRKQIWQLGSKAGEQICVVGPPTRRPADSRPTAADHDYCFLDQIGDRDAVLEVCTELARHNAQSPIMRFSSVDFGQQNRTLPLAVVGGPGDGTPENGNLLNLELTRFMRLPVAYSEDLSSLIIEQDQNRRQYEAEYRDGRLACDYGCIVRCRNPWSRNRRVLMIHAIHTYGVVGAAMALGHSDEGRQNVEVIAEVCGSDPLFYAWFPIPLVAGGVVIPNLDRESIVNLAASTG